MRANDFELRLARLRGRLRRQWFRWGLMPTLAVAFLAVGASVVHAADLDPTSRRAELQLQGAMALAAAAFLAGFWLEGYKTATDRVIRYLAAAAGVSPGDLTPALLSERADEVERLVLDAHWKALLLGWGAATSMVVGAAVGMSSTNLLLVVTIVVLYQLYLLSRHEHAVELLAGALSGDLAEEAQEMASQAEASLSWPQRVGAWFGWRPSPPSSSSRAGGRRRRPGRSRH